MDIRDKAKREEDDDPMARKGKIQIKRQYPLFTDRCQHSITLLYISICALFLGLPYLLHKGVYKDAFILHDETKEDPAEKKEKEDLEAKYGSQVCSK